MMSRYPEGIIDPHIHQWNPLTTYRHTSLEAHLLRRLPSIPRALRWLTPQADREFIGNPHHILRPYLPLDYRADAGRLPVATVVHIEAEWPRRSPHDAVEETRWICGLPFGQAGAPQLGAIVAQLDPRWSNASAILDEHLAVTPLVRGVRCLVPHHPDPGVRDFTDRPGVLSTPAFIRGFSAIAQRGLSFELWCYAHQLPEALALVREYPETTFVLNHYGTPVGFFGRRGKYTGRSAQERVHQLARWRKDIAALAAYPNVVAKHSGLGMPALGGERRRPLEAGSVSELTDQAAPLIQHLHSCFGADRTMWASNYPMDKPGLTIHASFQILIDVLGASADHHKLLRDVAARTYKIAPANIAQQRTAPHGVND